MTDPTRRIQNRHNDTAASSPAHSADSRRIVRTYKRSARAALTRILARDGAE